MVKHVIIAVILLVCRCAFAEIPYFGDTKYVWHVSKDGNNNNDGHSLDQAKITIGAAVTAASSGDTIIIWPGDYAESVRLGTKSLTLIGTSRSKTRIVPKITSGDGIVCADDTTIRNLTVCAVANDFTGVMAQSKNRITIEDCDITGKYDGINLSYTNEAQVRRCRIYGYFDGGNIALGVNHKFEDCTFITDGNYYTPYNARALYAGGAIASFTNCHFYASRNDKSAKVVGGLGTKETETYPSLLTLQNCTFYIKGGINDTGPAFGIEQVGADSRCTAVNCAFYVSAPSASSVYDVNVTGGLVVLGNCAYNSVSGNVKILDSLSHIDPNG